MNKIGKKAGKRKIKKLPRLPGGSIEKGWGKILAKNPKKKKKQKTRGDFKHPRGMRWKGEFSRVVKGEEKGLKKRKQRTQRRGKAQSPRGERQQKEKGVGKKRIRKKKRSWGTSSRNVRRKGARKKRNPRNGKKGGKQKNNP